MQTKGALLRVWWPVCNAHFFFLLPNHWNMTAKTNSTEIKASKQTNRTTFMQGKVASESSNDRRKGGRCERLWVISLSNSTLTALLRTFVFLVLYLASLRFPPAPSAQFQKLSRPSSSLPITSHFLNLALRAGKSYLYVFFYKPMEPLCLPSSLPSFPHKTLIVQSPFIHPLSCLTSISSSLVHRLSSEPWSNRVRLSLSLPWPCSGQPTLLPSLWFPLVTLSSSSWLSLSPLFAHSFLPSSLTSSTHASISFSLILWSLSFFSRPDPRV